MFAPWTRRARGSAWLVILLERPPTQSPVKAHEQLDRIALLLEQLLEIPPSQR